MTRGYSRQPCVWDRFFVQTLGDTQGPAYVWLCLNDKAIIIYNQHDIHIYIIYVLIYIYTYVYIYIYSTCTLYILLCRFIVITMFIQYIITNSVSIYICTCIFHVSPDVFRYTWSARHRLFNMWQARLRLQASTTGPTADWAHMFSTKDMTVSLSMCIQILRCIYNHAIWSKCISKDI